MPITVHHTAQLFHPIDTPVDVHIYPDYCNRGPPLHGTRKIYLQLESSAVLPCHDYLRQYGSMYDIILVFDPHALGLPNARKTIVGGTWIPPEQYTSIDLSKKAFTISNLTGSKAFTPGHLLRHVLYAAQKRFERFPITFFRSAAGDPMPVLGDNPMLDSEGCTSASGPSKMPLFETFQYSIVIENNREKNYFTEKIQDCIITKTIPIYWGCPNIGDYFDTSGWVILGDNIVEDLERELPKLDAEHYSRYLGVVNANYERARMIANPKDSYTATILPFVRPSDTLRMFAGRMRRV